MLKGNVVIVEDQPNFRKGLIKMFEEGQVGWNVVGEASNGQDALALVDRVKPDLVLTDIRMPVMDGIEFVGHLRKHYPDLLVIILTGYKNFEYAQAAVRLGALDLLIKPCTEQDVMQVMNKASERYYEKYAQQQHLLAQRKLQQDQELRAALLDLPSSYAAMKNMDEILLTKELWLLQLNSEDLALKNYGKTDLSLIQFAFSNIVEELLKGAGLPARLLLVEHDRFVVVADQPGPDESFIQAVQDASLEYLNIRVNVQPMGAAPPYKQLAEFYDQFKSSETPSDSDGERIDKEAGTGSGMTLSLNQAKVNELEMKLMSAILIAQENALQQLLNQLLTDLSHQLPEDMKIQALTLSIALLGTIQKQFDPDGHTATARIPTDMPQAHWTVEEVLRWADAQVNNFLLLFNHWQASKSDNVIEKATKYIEEHYNEECRLTDVAAHLHLNSSYFSVLFKKATGESFTRFVTRLRMDKAALLLRNTDMKIFEIACAIGFDEPNYFTNVFKQQFQMSPKEYRNHR
ncbi:response regulator [Paenibacillus chondroitinus]|uniref:Response regulator n=1 Tax=Paenibacillus chondroitinus TaxID=59842 RepID=A0ABU6DJE6_9BACL|nr:MULTISPECIES: response regulator [Paenibacillus]MCY9660216.1 response regulator [Paenibacillus anseongense]MEB4797641.1 response regulator [Paenibacillus chondroitinus]